MHNVVRTADGEPSTSAVAPSESDLPEAAGDDRIAFTRQATDFTDPLLWTANIDGATRTGW